MNPLLYALFGIIRSVYLFLKLWYIGPPLVLGILWIKTGASPFLWLSRLCLHLEAIRLQMQSSVAVAGRYFKSEYAATHANVRSREAEQNAERAGQRRGRPVPIREKAI